MILKPETCDIATKVVYLFGMKSSPFLELHLHKIFFVDNLSFLQITSLGRWSLALGHHSLYSPPLSTESFLSHPSVALCTEGL